MFDRILLKKTVSLEPAYKLETPSIIVIFLLTRALKVGAHVSHTTYNFLQQARGVHFCDQCFIHSFLCIFRTYYHRIFYITYSNNPLIVFIKLESKENLRTASSYFYGIKNKLMKFECYSNVYFRT
jgi:hypothetical protein